MQVVLDIEYNSELDSIVGLINSYIDFIRRIRVLSDDFHIAIDASPAINFRDSLHHYTKLYEAYQKNDILEFIAQKSSIFEHLNRGIKDAFIYILSNLSHKLATFLENNKYRSHYSKFRSFLHQFREVVLIIRRGNMDIKRIIEQGNKMEDLIYKHFKDMKEYILEKELLNVFINIK